MTKIQVHFLITILLVQLAMTFYVFIQSYDGRVKLVNAQREGCERVKRDRQSNARGWRLTATAEAHEHEPVVAAKYLALAIDLELRSSISCKKAFPDANLL